MPCVVVVSVWASVFRSYKGGEALAGGTDVTADRGPGGQAVIEPHCRGTCRDHNNDRCNNS